MLIFLFITTLLACSSNIDCRNNDNCNSTCNNGACITDAPLVCSTGNVCYEVSGECFPKCLTDSDCAALPTVLHYPNTGVCEKVQGKCYDCLTTSDCKPYKNETCNARCDYNAETKEYLCYDGTLCQNSFCIKNLENYECSLSNKLIPILFFFVFLLV